MSDEVIKNPARSERKTQVPYEPEYRRIGREPKNYPAKEEYASFDNNTFGLDGYVRTVDDKSSSITSMIDNNDYVFIENGFEPNKSSKETTELETPSVGEYILMVFGQIVEAGSIQKIEKRVKAIIYGEDMQFNKLAPTIDDIVVLKRVSIKIGVFINE